MEVDPQEMSRPTTKVIIQSLGIKDGPRAVVKAHKVPVAKVEAKVGAKDTWVGSLNSHRMPGQW